MEICREQFDKEIEAFAEEMDLDLECESEEDTKDLEDLKNKLFRAMQKGKLIFDDQRRPVVTTSTGEPLTFEEPTGAAISASDSKKQDQLVGKTFIIMANMTKTHPSTFAKMKMRDLKVCQAIFQLFSAA